MDLPGNPSKPADRGSGSGVGIGMVIGDRLGIGSAHGVGWDLDPVSTLLRGLAPSLLQVAI